jgi:hypothetical protein
VLVTLLIALIVFGLTTRQYGPLLIGAVGTTGAGLAALRHRR